jgi:hypothetical protein
MIATSYGKLFNEGGELLGEGPCQVDGERGSVTLRPVYDIPELERQHGLLRLELEDGTEMILSYRVIKFRVNWPGMHGPPGYKMFLANQQPLMPQQPFVPQPPPVIPNGPAEVPPEFRRPENIPPEFRRDG